MADNLFARAAKYRKTHKGLTQAEAVSLLSKQGKGKVTGTRKKAKRRVAGTKAAPKRKVPAVRAKTVNVRIGRTVKPKAHKTAGGKATAILSKIVRLEDKRKGLKGTEAKEINRLEINALHRKLETAKRAIR